MSKAPFFHKKLLRSGLAIVPALSAATLGGAIFNWFGVPLGWMLGGMSACMLITMSRGKIKGPRRLRPPMAVLLGLAIGAGFQPSMIAQMSQWLASLLLVIPILIALTLAGALYFTRIAGYDCTTAIYCALPGGLTEVALLAESVGADVRTISLVHAARIVITITVLSLGIGLIIEIEPFIGTDGVSPLVPASGSYLELTILVLLGFLAWQLGKKLGLPAPHMIAPLLLSAIIHILGWTTVELPTALVAAAQIVIGAGIGCRFADTSVRSLGVVFVHGAIFVGVVLSICALIGFGLASSVGQPVPTIVLAFSPGGLTELSLLALTAGLDAGFVAAHHLIRQITVVTLAPFITKQITTARSRPK